jgi:hypothetical protein
MKASAKLKSILAKRILERRNASKDLLSFTKYMKKDYIVNWHHKLIADDLTKVSEGKIKRLMVIMPPRMGKTELCSRHFPAFIFGNNRNANVISTSYSASLAARNSLDVQKIMDSQAYVDLFGKTIESKTSAFGKKDNVVRTQTEFRIINGSGISISSGVGGPIVGSGFNFGFIDDPFKNFAEANSITNRNKVYNWYENDFLTRQNDDNASIVLITTRWHLDDLAGRILTDIETGKEIPWKILHLEAIKEFINHKEDPREYGQILWEAKKGYIEQFKTRGRTFRCSFQGRPTKAEGELFKESWKRRFRASELPPFPRFKIIDTKHDGQRIVVEDFEKTGWNNIIFSIDTNMGAEIKNEKDKKKNAATSIQVIGETKNGNKYLLFEKSWVCSFVEFINALAGKTLASGRRDIENSLVGKFGFASEEIVIENKASAPSAISTLRDELEGLIKFNPKGDKETRASVASLEWEAGRFFIPFEDEIINGFPCTWITEFEKEIFSFPNSVKKDRVDAMSQAVIYLGGGTDRLISDPEDKG